MPPTDSPEGNMVEMMSPSEDEGQKTPSTRTSSVESISILTHPAAVGSPMLDHSVAVDSHAGTGLTWTQAEDRKQPVSLVSYKQQRNSQPAINNLERRLPIRDPIVNNKPLVLSNGILPFEGVKVTDIKSESAKHPTQKSVSGNLLQVASAHSHMSLPTSNSSASLVPADPNKPKAEDLYNVEESPWRLLSQVVIPFLIAGFGMVGAGIVLDKVQHWPVFEEVTAIYIVVPPLLGLKGNLEMTLASRLSTLANLGSMESKKNKLMYVGGNMLISQCLASLIGCLTSLLAVLIASLQNGSFNLEHSLLLIATSVATAAASSCILDSIMVLVILLSRKHGINPDNVATPIAASLGDICTTGLLAGIGTALYTSMDKILWLGPIVALVFLLLVPLWIYLASRHTYTFTALKTTTLPVIFAMFISTGAGFILDVAIKSYSDIAPFQPIINGVGGNLVAVHASRIATTLHRSSTMGILPLYHPTVWVGCISVFCVKDSQAMCARVLMSLVIPGHLIFIALSSVLATGGWVLSGAFIGVYLLASVLQVAVLIYVATIITYLVWRLNIDPDNFSIPLLTALGDLLGIGLLFIAFLFLEEVGEQTVFMNVS